MLIKFDRISIESELIGKRRLLFETLHVSENQIQIEPSKGSETFGKLSFTCPSEISHIVPLAQKIISVFVPEVQSD